MLDTPFTNLGSQLDDVLSGFPFDCGFPFTNVDDLFDDLFDDDAPFTDVDSPFNDVLFDDFCPFNDVLYGGGDGRTFNDVFAAFSNFLSKS